MTDEPFEDLRAALEWGASLELTEEQRSSLGALCHTIAGGAKVPSWRLTEEADRRRAAMARAEAAEQRVAELDGVLRNQRQEWCFRRAKAAPSPTRRQH